MQDTNQLCNRLIHEFAENYMGKLFYFCLRKTGDPNEAEDLTQDIALNVLTALEKGSVPESFSAWVWQIARNRYSVWADEKHKRHALVTGSDASDYEIEDDSPGVLDEMIHAEQIALLRRELAFIKSIYRNVVVSYYLDGKSIRDIAASMSLSVSAVEQRLFRARKILKEGMDMAREFGSRSDSAHRDPNRVVIPGRRSKERSQSIFFARQTITQVPFKNFQWHLESHFLIWRKK